MNSDIEALLVVEPHQLTEPERAELDAALAADDPAMAMVISLLGNRETVDEVWVTPAEALERAGELRLPPPQVRSFIDMREPAERGLNALLAATDERATTPLTILPRLCPLESGFALLLPWDPHYASAGTGDAVEMAPGHPLGVGPSRFVLEDMTWKNIYAPSSQSTD